MRRVLFASLLLLASCGEDSPSAPSTALVDASTPSAAIAVSIETEPVTPSGDSRTPLSGHWSVVVRETGGGVGANLTYVNTTLRDATSGARAWPTGTRSLGTDALTLLLGGARLAAGGTVRVPGELTYAFVSGSKLGVLTAAVAVTDDNGHVITALAEAEIR